jgi:MFS family permease
MLARGIAVWLQLVSIPLLAVGLGATPIELGLISALLFLPMLFIGALGGVLADRVDRGRALIITQVGSAALSLVLWALVASNSATLAWLAVVALAFGVITAIELPLRQAYLTELVPRDDVTSAVSLHATAWNTTRFIGPVVAGVLIATVGMAATFLFAAAVAGLVALSVVWTDRYRRAGRRGVNPPASVLEDLREGARYAAGEATIRWSLALVVAAGVLGIQAFQTLVPLLGARELGLDPGAYGLFVGMWGLGAVVGAVLVTTFARGDRRRWLMAGTLAMAAALAAIAIVDRVALAYALAFALGLAQIALVQNCMVTVQSVTPDPLRGRVMGIWVTVFQGTAPIGAILAGVLASMVGVRGAMLMAAVALALVGVVAIFVLPRVAWVTPRMARQRMEVADPTV